MEDCEPPTVLPLLPSGCDWPWGGESPVQVLRFLAGLLPSTPSEIATGGAAQQQRSKRKSASSKRPRPCCIPSPCSGMILTVPTAADSARGTPGDPVRRSDDGGSRPMFRIQLQLVLGVVGFAMSSGVYAQISAACPCIDECRARLFAVDPRRAQCVSACAMNIAQCRALDGVDGGVRRAVTPARDSAQPSPRRAHLRPGRWPRARGQQSRRRCEQLHLRSHPGCGKPNHGCRSRARLRYGVRPRSYGSRGLQSRASTAATPVVQLNAQFAPIPSWQRRIGAWHSCTSGPGARGINLSIRSSGGGCQCEMHALAPVLSSLASHRSTTSVSRSWQASRDDQHH